jgi:hypothetical protein
MKRRFAVLLIQPSRFCASICRNNCCYFQRWISREIPVQENKNVVLLCVYCTFICSLRSFLK